VNALLRKRQWCFCVALLMSIATPALAEPVGASKPDEKAASARFAEGLTQSRLGNYEQARVAFAQAHALKPGPATLRSLAAMEVRLGQWVAAARHLTEYFKTAKGPESVLGTARKSLEEARAHVGMVVVTIDVPNAMVKIDSDSVAQRTSRAEPWFIDPGPHVVRAQAEGQNDIVQTFVAEKGRLVELSLAFKPSAAPSSLAVEPTGAAAVSTVQSEPPGSSSAERLGTIENRRDDVYHGDRQESRGDTRTVLVVSGALLASVGLGVGIVYGLQSASARSDGDRLNEAIHGKFGNFGCSTPTSSASADCNALVAARDQYSRTHDLSVAGFVGFGIVGALTLGTFFLMPSSSVNGATSVSVSPHGVNIRRAF
jgi:hypothetical protein